MRLIVFILFSLLIFLQYQLWFTSGGVLSTYFLCVNLKHQMFENKKLVERNVFLMSDICNLRYDSRTIEEHARKDLGMIKKGEVFYKISTLYS
ncbi:septum formation initiator family protein [Coxiella endosymbiont of Amblyomma americanum]|uniref:septum formation initiator family protein n=1 Tax=Coxiella endosymbiont of Amblyomma americanum TaxID=325775 RepID=UPI0005805721|nr:septum formation initiator family protein [Coxiella endosymbiont of Amblyomma americanum]AJC50225.1 cell division protein FtsB [Coxiella endosymbiont of Amblyomma americanum]AUJ58587.1 cell division protein FtsB [Coxiella-like endosymbiont of Amblyomma americanum]